VGKIHEKDYFGSKFNRHLGENIDRLVKGLKNFEGSMKDMHYYHHYRRGFFGRFLIGAMVGTALGIYLERHYNLKWSHKEGESGFKGHPFSSWRKEVENLRKDVRELQSKNATLLNQPANPVILPSPSAPLPTEDPQAFAARLAHENEELRQGIARMEQQMKEHMEKVANEEFYALKQVLQGRAQEGFTYIKGTFPELKPKNQ